MSLDNKRLEIRKLRQQKNERRWINDVMTEIHTSIHDTHFNKISKCVDKTYQFTIRSSYIEDTYQSNTSPKSTTSIIQKTLDDTITPRINKINLQLLV